MGEQRLSDAAGAVFGQDAYLGDVSDVVAHTRTQDYADYIAAPLVQRDEGRLGIKKPASGKANDIVQKPQGAAEGAVLVVDI